MEVIVTIHVLIADPV